MLKQDEITAFVAAVADATSRGYHLWHSVTNPFSVNAFTHSHLTECPRYLDIEKGKAFQANFGDYILVLLDFGIDAGAALFVGYPDVEKLVAVTNGSRMQVMPLLIAIRQTNALDEFQPLLRSLIASS